MRFKLLRASWLLPFRHSPLFAILVLVTLAVGVGTNLAIFSVVDATLIQPLPHDEEGRLVRVFNRWGDRERTNLSPPLFRDVLERTDVFESFALYYDWRGANLTTEGAAEYVDVLRTSASLFQVLGLEPSIGRPFDGSHDEAGGDPVAVISHDLWQRRFGGSSDVLSASLEIEGADYAVIGVLPDSVRFPRDNADIWLPLRFSPDQWAARGNHSFDGIGKIRNGVAVEDADLAVVQMARSVRTDFPTHYPDTWGMHAVTHREVESGELRPLLLLLAGVVGVLLLVACGNLANLFLARAVRRRKEFAVRAALGGSRSRLMVERLMEGVGLAAVGTAAGCGLAWMILRAIRTFLPGQGAVIERAQLDLRALVLAFVIMLVTTLLFSVVPVLAHRGRDLTRDLRERSSSGGGRRARGVLVAGQVALAMIVVFASGLLGRSLLEQQRLRLGFETEDVAVGRIWSRSGAYDSAGDLRSLGDRLVAELSSRPGIESAGIGNVVPLGGSRTDRWIWIDGHPPLSEGDRLTADYRMVSPGYFDVLGIRTLAGRPLLETDHAESSPVVVINRSMEHRFWASRGEPSALGKRMKIGIDEDSGDAWLTVVGVVDDVRENLLQEPVPTFYVPFDQSPFPAFVLMARGSGADEGQLGRSLEEAVLAIDPQQPIYGVTTMRGLLREAGGQPRFTAGAVTAFTVLTLLLAGVGTYGVVSLSVAESRRALAISVALGAGGRAVVGRAFGRELRLLTIGSFVGLLAAVGLGRLAQAEFGTRLLYGANALEPSLVAMALTTVLLVAALACWRPARRALSVAPMEVLRDD